MLRYIVLFILYGVPAILKALNHLGNFDFVIERSKNPSWLAIMYEHIYNYFTAQTPFYIYIGTLAVVSLLVFPEYTISKIRDRFRCKLQIGFDIEKFPDCFVDTSEAYEDTQANQTVYLSFSQKWRIFIYNTSAKETIKNVEIKLIDINKCLSGDARNLPEVHLKFTHDNKREQRVVCINPGSRQFVDVIECYMKSGRSNENIFWVQHIEKNESHADLKLFYDNIDKEACKIRIEVTGENTTCKPKDFMIGLKDKVIKMWET